MSHLGAALACLANIKMLRYDGVGQHKRSISLFLASLSVTFRCSTHVLDTGAYDTPSFGIYFKYILFILHTVCDLFALRVR